jgi:hypothetical protein
MIVEPKPFTANTDEVNRQFKDTVLFEKPNEENLASQSTDALRAEVAARNQRENDNPYLYVKAKERLEALQAHDSGNAGEDSKAQQKLNRYLQHISEAEDRIAANNQQPDDEVFVMAYHDVFQPYIDEQVGTYTDPNTPEGQRLEQELDAQRPYTDDDKKEWLELKEKGVNREAGEQVDFRQLDRYYAPLEQAAQEQAVNEALEMKRLGDQMASISEGQWDQNELARTREYNRQINEALNVQATGGALSDEQKRRLDIWNKVKTGEIKAPINDEVSAEPTTQEDPIAGGPGTPPTEPNLTNILGQVDDGKVLSPEDQAIYNAWKTKHSDVIEPGQITAPEIAESTLESLKSFDELMALSDSEFLAYLDSLDDVQGDALVASMTDEQIAQASVRGTGIITDEEPPTPENPTSLHYDDKVDEPPEMNPNPPEEPNHDDQELAAADTALAEQKEAIYDQVLEKVRSGQPLTDEDKKILQEHDDALDRAEAAAAETAPSTALVPVAPPESPTPLEEEGFGTGPIIDNNRPPIGPGESPRNRGQALAEGLRNKFGEYRENPGKLAKDVSNMLKEGVHSWWNGIMPVDWIRPDEKNLLKRYKGWNLVAYYTGVAGGATIDLVAAFPGVGLLRPAVRAAIGVAAPLAMSRSEISRLSDIDNSNLSDEDKVAEKARLHEKYKRANILVANVAHGIAAGMVASTLLHAAGVDKLFRKPETQVVPPPQTGPAAPGPEQLPNAPTHPVPFTATEIKGGTGGFWNTPEVAQLKLPDWNLAPGAGANPTGLVGDILRVNAHRFGFPGEQINYADLTEGSKKLIELIQNSPTQKVFLSAGGQQLINDVLLHGK